MKMEKSIDENDHGKHLSWKSQAFNISYSAKAIQNLGLVLNLRWLFVALFWTNFLNFVYIVSLLEMRRNLVSYRFNVVKI